MCSRFCHPKCRCSPHADKRTALHISAAEGNLQAVRLLVEEGGASPEVADRWGHTPLDEARRVGAGPVIRYFAGMGPSSAAAPALGAATKCDGLGERGLGSYSMLLTFA